jgi:hypothetical protein
MMSKPRRGIGYAVMSAFVAWHGFVLVVAPAPQGSAVVEALHTALHPYLALLSLDNPWDFFAPNVNTGYKLHYDLEDAAGTNHTIVPMEELSWYLPSYIWNNQWQDAIIDDPEANARLAASLFCRDHAALHPAAVTLVKFEQKPFWPQDYLNGKRPLDPDFLSDRIVQRVPCEPQ